MLPNHNSQIAFPAGENSRACVFSLLLGKFFLPLFDFASALPRLEPGFDRLKVSNGLHEFRDRNVALPGGMGDIKPKVMLVGGQRRPNGERLPSVPAKTQTHFFEIPAGDRTLHAALGVTVLNL